MLNHEETSHESFRELCALAAIGELSEEELSELKAHISLCVSCRIEYNDYVELLHDKLSSSRSPRRMTSVFQIPMRAGGYRDRFLKEAERRGFQFSESTVHPAPFWHRLANFNLLTPAQATAIIALLLLGFIAVLGYKLRESDARSRALVAELSDLNDRTMLQKPSSVDAGSAAQFSTTRTDAVTKPPVTQEADIAENAAYRSLEAEISRTREENGTLLARSNALEEQLKATSLQVAALLAQVEAGKSSQGDLLAKLREAEKNLGDMTGEIQNLKNGRSSDASTIAVQETRMKEMSNRLREQAEALDRDRRLLAADRDIRDLMTARNLHIRDVYDVDSKGKDKKIFGRVFYTEDKSLIFYAFDVDERRVAKANYSLQAWGSRKSKEQSVRSLGILYVDDQKQNRWTLKFNDPEVLAQIDTVFVTIEPPGGSKKPTGEQLLYSYLRGVPNHP